MKRTSETTDESVVKRKHVIPPISGLPGTLEHKIEPDHKNLISYLSNFAPKQCQWVGPDCVALCLKKSGDLSAAPFGQLLQELLDSAPDAWKSELLVGRGPWFFFPNAELPAKLPRTCPIRCRAMQLFEMAPRHATRGAVEAVMFSLCEAVCRRLVDALVEQLCVEHEQGYDAATRESLPDAAGTTLTMAQLHLIARLNAQSPADQLAFLGSPLASAGVRGAETFLNRFKDRTPTVQRSIWTHHEIVNNIRIHHEMRASPRGGSDPKSTAGPDVPSRAPRRTKGDFVLPLVEHGSFSQLPNVVSVFELEGVPPPCAEELLLGGGRSLLEQDATWEAICAFLSTSPSMSSFVGPRCVVAPAHVVVWIGEGDVARPDGGSYDVHSVAVVVCNRRGPSRSHGVSGSKPGGLSSRQGDDLVAFLVDPSGAQVGGVVSLLSAPWSLRRGDPDDALSV